MTNDETNGQDQSQEKTTDDPDIGISDEQLPEDLQPTDDNPLAKPPSEDQEQDGPVGGGAGPVDQQVPPQ